MYFLTKENCLRQVKYILCVLIQYQSPYVTDLDDYLLAGLLLSYCEEQSRVPPTCAFTPEVCGGLFAPLTCLANSLGSCTFPDTLKWADLQSVLNLRWERLQ